MTQSVIGWGLAILCVAVLAAGVYLDWLEWRRLKRRWDDMLSESERQSMESNNKLKECQEFRRAMEWRTAYRGPRGQA